MDVIAGQPCCNTLSEVKYSLQVAGIGDIVVMIAQASLLIYSLVKMRQENRAEEAFECRNQSLAFFQDSDSETFYKRSAANWKRISVILGLGMALTMAVLAANVIWWDVKVVRLN